MGLFYQWSICWDKYRGNADPKISVCWFGIIVYVLKSLANPIIVVGKLIVLLLAYKEMLCWAWHGRRLDCQYKLVDLGVHSRQWYRKVASLVKNRMQADLTSRRRETQCMWGQYEPVRDCSYTTQRAQILWGWKMERKTKKTKQLGLLLSGSLVLSVLQHSVRSARPRLTCMNSPT